MYSFILLMRHQTRDLLLQFPSDWAMSPLKVIHETPKKKSGWSEFLESNLHDESTTRDGDDDDKDYDPTADAAAHVSRLVLNRKWLCSAFTLRMTCKWLLACITRHPTSFALVSGERRRRVDYVVTHQRLRIASERRHAAAAGDAQGHGVAQAAVRRRLAARVIDAEAAAGELYAQINP